MTDLNRIIDRTAPGFGGEGWKGSRLPLERTLYFLDPETVVPIGGRVPSERPVAPASPYNLVGVQRPPMFIVVRRGPGRAVVEYAPTRRPVTSALPVEKAMEARARIEAAMAALGGRS